MLYVTVIPEPPSYFITVAKQITFTQLMLHSVIFMFTPKDDSRDVENSHVILLEVGKSTKTSLFASLKLLFSTHMLYATTISGRGFFFFCRVHILWLLTIKISSVLSSGECSPQAVLEVSHTTGQKNVLSLYHGFSPLITVKEEAKVCF